MSTEIAVSDDYDVELARQLGTAENDSVFVDVFPLLTINTKYDDKEGNRLPPGTFHVDVDNEEYFAEAKNTQFRIYANFFNVQHFDKNAGTNGLIVNQSVLIPNMFEKDVPDQLGGFKCGKASKKERENLTEDQKSLDEEKSWYRFLFGMVKMTEAVNRKGEACELDWTPVLFKNRGSNFMWGDEVIKGIATRKLNSWSVPVSFKLKREEFGQTIYYVITPEIMFDSILPSEATDIEFMKAIIEYKNDFNNEIKELHDKACLVREKSQIDKGTLKDLDGDFTDVTPENDLDDDIPF